MTEIKVPLVDFSSLGDLGETYYKAKKRASEDLSLADLGRDLSEGRTPNYQALAGGAFKSGNRDLGLSLLKLGEAQQKQLAEEKAAKDFSILAGGMFNPTAGQPALSGASSSQGAPSAAGGLNIPQAPSGGQPPLSPTPSSSIAPAISAPGPSIPQGSASSVPVPPSSRWWGDAEAENAGLYEPRGNPASVQPTQLQARPQSVTLAQLGQPAQSQVLADSPTPQRTPVAPSQSYSSQVGALITATANPRLPQAQRDVAKILLGKALDEGSLTGEQKDYALYIRQGGTKSFHERQIELKRAGAPTQESAERAEIGKGAGQRANEAMKAASAAPRMLQNLNRIDGLLGQVDQGKLQPGRMSVSAWARSFGLDDKVAERLGLDPKNVGTAQAIQAMTNEIAMGRIGSGGIPANNFSDADRNFIVATVPGLANEPAGNKLMIEAARRIAQLDIEKGREWIAFRRNPNNKGSSFDDFEADWNDRIAQRDMFGDLIKQAQAITPYATVPPASSAAPPAQGARRASDGNWYISDPQRPGKYLQVR